ncbi:MAG: peptidase E [Clostridiales bacterium]|nr:peptidase E [Clostridiales bacterium]
MSTIAAIGGGRYDNGEIFPILMHTVSLSGKQEPNLLYVPTAGFDYIIGDEVIADMFRQCGCKIGTLFLTDVRLTEADIRRKIMGADIIYAGGGSLNFLMTTWKATKADKYFKEAYESGKILSGCGAGAMCWFSEGMDIAGKEKSPVFIDCLGLLPYSCCTEFEKENRRCFEEKVKTRNYDGLALESGTAAVFKDGETYSLGADGKKAALEERARIFKNS